MTDQPTDRARALARRLDEASLAVLGALLAELDVARECMPPGTVVWQGMRRGVIRSLHQGITETNDRAYAIVKFDGVRSPMREPVWLLNLAPPEDAPDAS